MTMIDSLRHAVRICVAALALLVIGSGASLAQERVTVFAAASMKNALDAAGAAWTQETGVPTSISYAGSSVLAKQIEAGAPADVFISADLDWMDYLTERQLIDPSSRTDLLSNRIVLIGPKGAGSVDIKPGFDMVGLLGEGRLAMAAPESVPAGKYGKAALQKLGVWQSLQEKIAGAENVRTALQYVSRGEAPYGIVYQTDAKADSGVTIVGVFPEDSHPPIVYPAALLKSADNPSAASLLSFLKSEKARPYFEAEGFEVLEQK